MLRSLVGSEMCIRDRQKIEQQLPQPREPEQICTQPVDVHRTPQLMALPLPLAPSSQEPFSGGSVLGGTWKLVPPSTSSQKLVRACKCRKSKCLKLYCDCFSASVLCQPECVCIDCGNVASNPQAASTKKRKPRAPKTQGQGSCRCKRSSCQKKYCECYQAKVACNESCQCVGCRNSEEHRLRFSRMMLKHDAIGEPSLVPQLLHPAPL
eukprot:TRINITY_DN20089_c0_g1_i6.p1 TRINITY_DN20089_c0_g1~~TRINITY_DN20089_c0_g1_i6.p1  ORF type:complete len:209 (-),score=31.92 TRINITY_DN20089_c0_g1_i6:103-729(-)